MLHMKETVELLEQKAKLARETHDLLSTLAVYHTGQARMLVESKYVEYHTHLARRCSALLCGYVYNSVTTEGEEDV